MIHEAYMPVYMGSRFLARVYGCTYGSTRGSTKGPRGPKNKRESETTIRRGESEKHSD